MGLDDLLDFGDELGKAKELAETLWDDREKITDTANLVWDNKDDLIGVIDFVREHGDDLLDLLKKVPEILGQAGDGLSSAGQSAVQAGTWLVDEKGGVAQFADLAADAIEACLDQLGAATSLIGDLSDEIDKLSIPSLSPTYTEVMGFNVITGIDIGEVALVDQATDRLRDGTDQIQAIAGNLGDVAGNLRDLGVKVADAGDELQSVGVQLHDSGQTPTTISGSKKQKAPKVAKRGARSRPTAVKKAKKRAAKRAKPRTRATTKRS